jgi:hypothetical protein
MSSFDTRLLIFGIRHRFPMSGVKEYVLSFLRRFGCLPSACQFVPSRIIQAEAKVLFFLEHSSEPARVILGKKSLWCEMATATQCCCVCDVSVCCSLICIQELD